MHQCRWIIHSIKAQVLSQTQNKDEHADHYKEHGGQIYQATQLDTQWLLDEDGQGTLNPN
jgi:copper resistance protein B